MPAPRLDPPPVALPVEPAVPAEEPSPRAAARRIPVDDDEPSELEPVEPSEPVVAKATGIDAIAAPIPNAIANAPTRPIQRA